MLNTEPLKEGESYATLARIRDVADLPELPVEVPEWAENGQRCIVLVRALSFKERRAILNEVGEDADLQKPLIVLYGIKAPSGLTRDHLEMLESKHPNAIDALAATIEALGTFDAAAVYAHVTSVIEGRATAEKKRKRPAQSDRVA